MWSLSGKKNSHKHKRQAGFTLLECVLAMGILATVTVQIVSIQGTYISLAQSAVNNIKASWAMRQGVSQLEYVLETLGVEGLRQESEFVWPSPDQKSDDKFTVKIVSKETLLEASQLLGTVMRIGKAFSNKGQPGDAAVAENKESDEMTGMVKQMSDMAGIPKDMYRSVSITVSWLEGSTPRTLEGGFLLIDDKKLLSIGQGIPGLGALGGGGNDGASGGNSPPPTKPSPGGQPNQPPT